jgi:hypothetical protein
MNLVGPLPTSTEGNKYLLTIIDRSTRYLGAVLLKETLSPDQKCLAMISIKSPWLGHVTPDI